MTFVSCPDRDRILAAKGHVLVTGGPGCGKTSVALRKALLRIGEGLQPGQKVLFLSFSRAAVARIVQAARADLPRESRSHLDIQTFHSFCWHFVQGHGYLLGAPAPLRLLAPPDERALRAGATHDDPKWDLERERLFADEGRIVFDLFAPKALAILQRSKAHRALLASRYPLIIVDEAQDTGTEQWGCIETLAQLTQLVCLADLDQQIYEYRRDVSADRLKHIMAALKPLEVDLGAQNKRSPSAEIVAFGNDILAATPRGASYRGVSHFAFRPDAANRDIKIRQAVGFLNGQIMKETKASPQSVAFLTAWGKGVAIIARALQGGGSAREIPHRVAMDEAEVLLATRVIASCLEPVDDLWQSLSTSLSLLAELYRAKGNIKKAQQLAANAIDASNQCLRGRAKCPGALHALLTQIRKTPFSGNPAQDWLTIRHAFQAADADELKTTARLVVYLMAFNRGRRISDRLTEAWQRHGSYVGARALIDAAVTEDQIIGTESDPTGIHVMTIHKSKGKEFDGVVILHLGNNISPICPDSDPAPHKKSRRLLRVGITRARHHTLMLTDAFSPSPVMRGHKL
jgi:DNA helicase-2/ATP-dependent DNA helicase PcrA